MRLSCEIQVSIVGKTIDLVTHIVKSGLQAENFDPRMMETILESIQCTSNPFIGLQSKYFQDQYLENEILLVKPFDNILGYILKNTYSTSTNTNYFQQVSASSIYIPIIDSLH